MSTEEKPSKKILIGVTGSVISAAIVGIYNNWFPPLFHWTGSAVLVCWNWLWLSHQWPGWLLFILMLCAVCGFIAIGILVFMYFFEDQGMSGPTDPNFTEFYFRGLQWRWRWVSRQVSHLAPFCPRCDLQLVGCNLTRWSEILAVKFQCEGCGYKQEFEGSSYDQLESLVEREISRQLRESERKDSIQKAPAAK